MKQLLVISGKGGTGKTTITGALADIASRDLTITLADADVDAANLELLLEPTLQETFPFKAGKTVTIDPDECIQCGRCEEVCRFDAVEQNKGTEYVINSHMCEGCLSCLHQCPVDAIHTEERISGEWYRSLTPYGTLFHANLFPGEENSGKLVTQIKTDAELHAQSGNSDLLLIDGPPGIGCPVTAACQGVDAAVIVSEPTVSGLHDLKRVKLVTNHFRIPSFLIINKHDLNPGIREEMWQYAQREAIPVLGEIPYNEDIIHAQAQGKPVTRVLEGKARNLYEQIWEEIQSQLIAAKG